MNITSMSLSHVEELLGWAANEGWNPGLDDAAAFFTTDPDGFLMMSEGNRTIAGISVVKYNNQQGFLGLYICHPEYRGKGLGFKLWSAGIKHLEGFTIGLDGVVAQQSNYQKSGFEYAYRNIRYAGIPHNLKTTAAESEGQGGQSLVCRSINETDHASLLTMDASIHGFDRHRLLNHWLRNNKNRHSIVCTDQEKIVGAGTIRRCLQGSKIGPLLAENSGVANTLIATLVNQTQATEITLDVPEPNQAATDLARAIGLTPCFETARMYKGNAPSYRLEKLFGVTTFELG